LKSLTDHTRGRYARIRLLILPNRKIILIMLFGLMIRLVFMLFFAGHFFGRTSIYEDGDTWAWAKSFQLLFERGIYTVNTENVYGFFARMPGYSFFIGIFWLICGKDWSSAYVMVAWAQIILDVIAVGILYKLAEKILNGHTGAALVIAFLYACYPFVVVWNPVVYSESLSIFLLIVSLYFYTKNDKNSSLILAGVFLGLLALTRPQGILLIPVYALLVILQNRNSLRTLLKRLVFFSLAISMTYGLWPVRSYVFHHKIVLSQDLRGIDNWNIDVLSFLQYIYSVKAEWEPQYSNIIHNEKVVFPSEAYCSMQDSLKLERAVLLSKNCGSGFSHKQGYWGKPFDQPDCNREIAALFNDLRQNQIKINPWNFYLKVPLQNLSKAVFKSQIVDERLSSGSLATLMLMYRTIMIILGLAGLFIMYRTSGQAKWIALLIVFFVVGLYLLLCAGTWVQCRNIELRYFLPADILLLIPAGCLLHALPGVFRRPS
jgi:hypothetical protein